MEGVIDHQMRQLLTSIGGYDRCVTEFIRVTVNPVPAKVFRRLCPELDHGGVTPSGVPVYVQLLGGNAELMARSAVTACNIGARGIDINFGCPAKIVNRHDGGSVLLRQPDRIHAIVAQVRDRVDPDIPVCAKIRLGYDNSNYLDEIVAAVDAAGADELCIHARTRMDGYKPPAYWAHIGNLATTKNTRLIVNGEIWNAGDARQARQQSGCRDLMIGRGGLARPDLARIIRADLDSGGAHYQPMSWPEVAALVDHFFHQQDSRIPKYVGNRTKQWLAYLKRQYPGAESLFKTIKRYRDFSEISGLIRQHRRQIEKKPMASPTLGDRLTAPGSPLQLAQ